MSRLWLLLSALTFLWGESIEKNIKCVPRDYGNGGTVCVCNATFCDTIEPLPPFNNDEYSLYLSSQAGLRFEYIKEKFQNQPKKEVLEITVDPTVTYQKIYGFGGAFTDAACMNINTLNSKAKKKLLASYFSRQGIEYNFGRVPIGGTDFSTRKYTLDDSPGDLSLEKFQLSPEDINDKVLREGHILISTLLKKNGLQKPLIWIRPHGIALERFFCHHYKTTLKPQENKAIVKVKWMYFTTKAFEVVIPIILAAQSLSRKPIHLMAAAWTAPPWMKTNNDYICFGLLKSDFYDLWAKYHLRLNWLRFLEEYKKYGLKFWAVTTGNEPTAGLLPYYSFNCMGWTPFSQSKWVSQNLGPHLKNSEFNETIIIGIEDQRFTLPWWPKILFRNPETKNFIAGIGLHWYWDNYLPVQLLDWTHSAFPDKFILSTEACFVKERGLPAVLLGSWKRGEKYASNIISNINHYVGGWIDWNLALDLKGGPNWVDNVVDSPVIVNSSSGEFYKQPMFYALGHFSKFVPEGSVRIKIKRKYTLNFDTVGFLTPENNIVVVLLNRKKTSIWVSFEDSKRGSAIFQMPEKSIATFIYKNLK